MTTPVVLSGYWSGTTKQRISNYLSTRVAQYRSTLMPWTLSTWVP